MQSPELPSKADKEPSLFSNEQSFEDDKKGAGEVFHVVPTNPTTGADKLSLVSKSISLKQKIALYSFFAVLSFAMSLGMFFFSPFLRIPFSIVDLIGESF